MAGAVDRVRPLRSTGPPWTGAEPGERAARGRRLATAAPWPRVYGLPWRRCGAPEVMPRAPSCSFRQGERDARGYRDRKWPRRWVRMAGRLGGGRRTLASSFAQHRGGGRKRKAPAWSSPCCEARVGVLAGVDEVAGKTSFGGFQARGAAMAAAWLVHGWRQWLP